MFQQHLQLKHTKSSKLSLLLPIEKRWASSQNDRMVKYSFM